MKRHQKAGFWLRDRKEAVLNLFEGKRDATRSDQPGTADKTAQERWTSDDQLASIALRNPWERAPLGAPVSDEMGLGRLCGHHTAAEETRHSSVF